MLSLIRPRITETEDEEIKGRVSARDYSFKSPSNAPIPRKTSLRAAYARFRDVGARCGTIPLVRLVRCIDSCVIRQDDEVELIRAAKLLHLAIVTDHLGQLVAH